jgi:hypothetical protein
MNYAKAMKHARNVRKIRQMSRGHYMTIGHELTPAQIQKMRAYQRAMQGK